MDGKKIQGLTIGIVGAGFSGVALALALSRLATQPLRIILFEKTGDFAAGEAYKTPYPFHLLNVKANDMSAFFAEKDHFVSWLRACSDTHRHMNKDLELGEQYAPRCLYGVYLKELLTSLVIEKSALFQVTLEATEVVAVTQQAQKISLATADQRCIEVDKVVLAMGNFLPQRFPFAISGEVNCIYNPWEYRAPAAIGSDDAVLIVGTGLSMIDAVLTLHHHGHQGRIDAVSRHGLLPLAHREHRKIQALSLTKWPQDMRALVKQVRADSQKLIAAGGDWRAIITALREHSQPIWEQFSIAQKKNFLTHVLPYWNIHRHRVHPEIHELLITLQKLKKLRVIAGRVLRVEAGCAYIQTRHQHAILERKVQWIINCMGPSLTKNAQDQPLLQSLFSANIAVMDAFGLGLETTKEGALKNRAGQASARCYAVGPLRRGVHWESGAVPDIRKQCDDLAKCLLLDND